MENTIRVLIADEDKEFCAMLRETFCIDERMEIIGTYGDGNGLAQRILQDAPDVVLMDLVLPGVDGLTVLHELNEAEPAHFCGEQLCITGDDGRMQCTGCQFLSAQAGRFTSAGTARVPLWRAEKLCALGCGARPE